MSMTAADEGVSMNDSEPATRALEIESAHQQMSVVIPSSTKTDQFYTIYLPSSTSSSPLSSAPTSPVFPRTPPRIKQEVESDYERSRHLSRRVAVERAKSVPCRITRNTWSNFGLLTPLSPKSKERGRLIYQDSPRSCLHQTPSRSKPVIPTRRSRRNTVGVSSASLPCLLLDPGPPYSTPNDIADAESDYGRSRHISRLFQSTPTAASRRTLRYSYSSSSSPLSSAPSSPVFPSTPRAKHIERGNGADYKLLEAPFLNKSVAPHGSKRPTTSRYFPKPPQKRPKTGPISCIPFPPLASPTFGLVQESLQHDPFRLFIAVIFLNKTRGTVAMPVYHALMTRYPTPEALAEAKLEDVVGFFQHLGLQNQRAKKCIALAEAWLTHPPEEGKRYRRLHYPNRNDGKDIPVGNGPIPDDDSRVAWEVGHLPGIGAYAIDSWRIFCRDRLRGLPIKMDPLPQSDKDDDKDEQMQGEWARVLPLDKELRAYLRWRWLRVGWVWDPLTGERKPAGKEVLAKLEKGGVVVEGDASGEVLGEYHQGPEMVVKREVEEVKHGDVDGGKEDENMVDVEGGEEEEWMFTPSSWRLRSSDDGV